MPKYTIENPSGGKPIVINAESELSDDEIDQIVVEQSASIPTPKPEALSSLEQFMGGKILDPTTGERSSEQVGLALQEAALRGSQAQGDIDRQQSLQAMGTPGALAAGMTSVPQGLGEILKLALAGSGMGTERQVANLFPTDPILGQAINEAASVSPLVAGIGSGIANAAMMGRGGAAPLNLARSGGALTRGETGLASELAKLSLLEAGVGGAANVGIGQGLRTLTGSDTTTGDVSLDLILGALTAGRRVDPQDLQGLVRQQAADVVPATPVTVVENALSRALREKAEKNVEQALVRGGGTKKEKAIAERLAPQILNRPFMETFALTGKGLEKKAREQRQKFGEAIEEFGTLEGSTDPKRIVTLLEKEKANFVVDGKVFDPDSVQIIERLQNNFSQYGDSISQEGIRKIMRTYGEEIAKSGGFIKTLSEGSVLDLKKTAYSEMRDIISENNPDLAKINKQFSFWAGFDDVITATNSRVRPHTGFSSRLASVVGAATGTGIGDMAARALTGKIIVEAIGSPGWKLASAKIKNSLANAIAYGDAQKIMSSLRNVQGFDLEQALKTAVIQSSSESSSVEEP